MDGSPVVDYDDRGSGSKRHFLDISDIMSTTTISMGSEDWQVTRVIARLDNSYLEIKFGRASG